MEPEDFLEDGTVKVWEETFAVVKSEKSYSEAFATINDGNKTTVIIKEGEYKKGDVKEVKKGWKILTFDMTLPFKLVGFLAEVAQILAEEGISIFAISAFSTDHILVKEADLEPALEKLRELGCNIER